MAIHNTFSYSNTKILQPEAKLSIGKICIITNENIVLPEGKHYIGPFKSLSDIKNLVSNNGRVYSMVETAISQEDNFLQAGSASSYVIYKMEDVEEATQTSVEISLASLDLTTLKAINRGALTLTLDGNIQVVKNINLSILSDNTTKAKQQIKNILSKTLYCEVEYDDIEDKLIFKSTTFGSDGTLTFSATTGLTAEETDLYTILDFANSTITDGKNDTGFDLSKFIDDGSFAQQDFLFYSFSTTLRLSMPTIQAIVNQLNLIRQEHNIRMCFAYQMPSYKMATTYDTILANTLQDYYTYFATFTSLISSENFVNANASLLSYICSTDITETGTINNIKKDINAHKLNLNIAESEHRFTQSRAMTLMQHIAFYTTQITLNNIVQAAVGDIWQPTDTAYLVQIDEYLKLQIPNFLKLNRNISITEMSLLRLVSYLYNKSSVFLSNGILRTDPSNSKLSLITVNNVEAMKKNIQQYGIYFEYPPIETLTSNTFEMTVVISLTSGLVRVGLNNIVLK